MTEKKIDFFLKKLQIYLSNDAYELEMYFYKNKITNKNVYYKESYFESDAVKEYLKNYTLQELRTILVDFKKLDFHQKNIFLNALSYNSTYYSNPLKPEFSLHKLDRELWRIKKGMVNINFVFRTGDGTCKRTILGFIRALRAGTVFTTKMNIDGERRRVIVKNKIGVSKEEVFNQGFYNLILDLKTFDIYDFYNPSKKEHLTLKEISRFTLYSKVNKNIEGMLYPNYSIYKPILKKEIEAYFKRHQENTSFQNRHNLKKPSLFERVKKKKFRK